MPAGTTFTNPVGGFWPLGFIQAVTPGTPVLLTFNVGSQAQSGMQMAKRIRGFVISTPGNGKGGINTTGNTKNVYVVFKGNNKDNYAAVIACIGPGQVVSLPGGGLLEGACPTPDQFALDADISGEGAYITAIYG